MRRASRWIGTIRPALFRACRMISFSSGSRNDAAATDRRIERAFEDRHGSGRQVGQHRVEIHDLQTDGCAVNASRVGGVGAVIASVPWPISYSTH